MYIVTALDGLYVERQLATRNPVTARELFNEWAEKWNMHVFPDGKMARLGNKSVRLYNLPCEDKECKTLYAITTIDNSDDLSICMQVKDEYIEAIRVYLQTLLSFVKDGVSEDIDGNDMVDNIMFIMTCYKVTDSFDDTIRFDDSSVIFRTLKVV